MRKISLLICLIPAILVSCSNDDDQGLCLIGSGAYNDYTIQLDPFNEIALFGPVDLEILQDEEQKVIITSEPEIINYVSYEVNNQRLDIGIKDDLDCFETDEGVTISISVPDLESIYVVGYSDISSIGDLQLDNLLFDIQGAANITISGTVDEQEIDVSGEVRLYNFDLLSDQSDINVNGSAEIEVTCESQLDINVTGRPAASCG